MSKTFEDLITLVKIYNPDEVERVTKAYKIAKVQHEGQYRQSGEEYIIHPVNVTYILAQMHADGDTLCAGLLHDAIEDGNLSKEDIAKEFNEDVANLVDGVTKLSKMNYISKHKLNCANTRKLITGMMGDVRVIIIKLADRLHNMRTLGFKSDKKQKENAMETLEVFVPLANYIGALDIKTELENLSLMYINPDKYLEISDLKSSIEIESYSLIQEMLGKISYLLNSEDIPYELKVRTKSIFSLYKKLETGKRVKDIHDLLAIKVLVEKVKECYQTLGVLHSAYHPADGEFQDFICNPKTNMYQALHTTLIGPEGRLIQGQISTYDMDKVSRYGLSTYWDIHNGDARNVMQKKLKEQLQFYRSLRQIDAAFTDDEEFVLQVKSELFGDKIYVYTVEGDIIELPKGATPIDFAYQIHSDVGNHMIGATVNDQIVPLNYQLKNKDRVKVFQSEFASPQEIWEEYAVTTRARRKMREYYKRNA